MSQIVWNVLDMFPALKQLSGQTALRLNIQCSKKNVNKKYNNKQTICPVIDAG